MNDFSICLGTRHVAQTNGGNVGYRLWIAVNIHVSDCVFSSAVHFVEVIVHSSRASPENCGIRFLRAIGISRREGASRCTSAKTHTHILLKTQTYNKLFFQRNASRYYPICRYLTQLPPPKRNACKNHRRDAFCGSRQKAAKSALNIVPREMYTGLFARVSTAARRKIYLSLVRRLH